MIVVWEDCFTRLNIFYSTLGRSVLYVAETSNCIFWVETQWKLQYDPLKDCHWLWWSLVQNRQQSIGESRLTSVLSTNNRNRKNNILHMMCIFSVSHFKDCSFGESIRTPWSLARGHRLQSGKNKWHLMWNLSSGTNIVQGLIKSWKCKYFLPLL